MIICKLMGGLGNQMFQYAIGKTIAKINNAELYLDKSQLSSGKDISRQCELDFLCTEYSNYKGNNVNFSYDIKNLTKFYIKNILNLFPFRIIQERKLKNIIFDKLQINSGWYNFNQELLNIKDDAYLIGFRQSYKYFEQIEKSLKKDFQPKEIIKGKNKDLLQKIKGHHTCSIHIRRGDYTNGYHGFCSLDYYNRAINFIKNKKKDTKFLVFSNDIEFCKTLFIGDEYVFVDWNIGKESYRDLILMSKCDNNIIANSSFSRWGGYLNDNPNKIVIAPKKRFNIKYIDTSDLIPGNWIRI